MFDLISQIPLCALLAGLLGLYIGYQLAKNSCNDVEELEHSHH